MTRSPWERALGDRFNALDPQLAAYFAAIPEGWTGHGVGVFAVAGSRRRWLWPALAVLARLGIAFPEFEHGVPFTVTNRYTPAGTVRAERVFRFTNGDRVMRDEIGITKHGLVDRLGDRGVLETTLAMEVAEGALILRSIGAAVRLGKLRLALGPFAPRVTLSERAEGHSQHVSLAVDIPGLGTVYEYAGRFTYTVLEDQ